MRRLFDWLHKWLWQAEFICIYYAHSDGHEYYYYFEDYKHKCFRRDWKFVPQWIMIVHNKCTCDAVWGKPKQFWYHDGDLSFGWKLRGHREVPVPDELKAFYVQHTLQGVADGLVGE